MILFLIQVARYSLANTSWVFLKYLTLSNLSKMADKTIAIYCFLDDFFRAIGRKTDVHCKRNDAEIATTALIAALYFHGNQASAMGYMQKHHGLRKLDKSGFNRRLHRLEEPLIAIFHALGTTFKQLNTTAGYVIDSFPVAYAVTVEFPFVNCFKARPTTAIMKLKKNTFMLSRSS